MSNALAILAALSIAFGPVLPVRACCMVPKDYKGTIGQSAQEAVLFYHDGREELILKINYKITGEVPPDRFAWIITVPSEPDGYAVAEQNLFDEVFGWADPLVGMTLRQMMERKLSVPAAPVKPELEFGKRIAVGPYDIQPVRALAKEALEGLNTWLDKNGFPTEDPKHMEYFVENKFTFLCVKVTPVRGQAAVERAAGVAPLRLSFKTPRPYYPLKFSSRQGVFDLNLYILTKQEFDYESSKDSLLRLNWTDKLEHNVTVQSATFPKALKEAFNDSALKQHHGDWFLNVIRTQRVNDKNPIKAWKEDIFFSTKS